MLERLKIRSFKSVLEADPEPGKVNLFVGSNGSGKSNIQKAVDILSDALGRGVLPRDFDAKRQERFRFAQRADARSKRQIVDMSEGWVR